MSGARSIWIYAGLLVAALAVAIAASQQSAPASFSASIYNPGPGGLRALYLYLEETGFEVAHEDESLEEIPETVKTLVIAAPRIRLFDGAEVDAVRSFVERGGILIYLAPRLFGAGQGELDRWLRLRPGEWLHAEPFRVRNSNAEPSSAAVDAWVPFFGQPIRQIDISGDRGVEVEGADSLPVAGNSRAIYGWWREMGAGEVWIFAGPDFAQNDRIEEADNIELWEALAARGPILFDESHHRLTSGRTGDAARALWIVAAQFVACALFFAYARGSRLGPPRPEIVERHRSSREYLESFAWLTRRARVEKQLLREAIGRLRIAMQERLSIPVSFTQEDAARALEERSPIPAARLLEVEQRVRHALASSSVSPAQFAQIVRECAQLERIIAGHGRG